MVVMAARLPLPTLLSHVLVAFTIEFDNEAEHRMTHRTTNGPGVTSGLNAPWLVSQVMWANVLQFVGADGVRLSELEARARTTRHSLSGLQRWGYVAVAADPADVRPVASTRDPMILPTAAGRLPRMFGGPWRASCRDAGGSGSARTGSQHFGDRFRLWSVNSTSIFSVTSRWSTRQ
jgi:hypothetical protein